MATETGGISPWRGPLRVLRALRARPRLLAGVLAGGAATLVMPSSLAPLTRAILAWDIGVLLFLALAAHLFTAERDSTLPEDAAAQEEGEWSIFAVTLGAVVASFAAIVGEFSTTKEIPPTVRGLHIALVVVTLLVSWLLTHTLFAMRYAHEFYQRSADGSGIDRGLEFPGTDAPGYWDFFYFSLVLGMTFQVSDVQISSAKLRGVATVHGLLSFLFNTVILALSVNIGASLL